MKAAIVTFQGAENYGAVLQAFALSTWLRKHQITPEIINYDSKIYRKYKLFRTFRYKSQPAVLVADLLAYKGKSKRSKNFAAFRSEYLPITEKTYKSSKELSDISDTYDYYLCGSDQIWNPEITDGVDGIYFLDFVDKKDKKIAYAPSVGVNYLNDFQTARIEEYLTSFHALSVREQSGNDLLQPFCKKKITTVCDPVFLLDADDFKPICGSPVTQDKYVFLYVVGPARTYESVIRYSERLAAEKGLRLFYIIDGDKTLFHISGTNMYGCNPTTFISLICHAQYAVSNSFHATAFSLIYGKQFVTFAKQGTNSRMTSLLQTVGLDNRMISPDFNIDDDINQETLRINLRKFRSGSEEYLESSLDIKEQRSDEEDLNRESARHELNRWVAEQEGKNWIAIHKDKSVRASSRSGGVFTALSDAVFDKGGVVYGCKMEGINRALHSRATNTAERDAFRGSKYIQSEMRDCFKSIKNDLDKGIIVLFSGTGCQVAGLKAFLAATKTDSEKLFTMDIVCHGVPSRRVWNDYVKAMQKRHNGAVEKVDFRNKTRYGWKAHFETVTIGGRDYSTSEFRIMFYKHHILRPSCYACPYANLHRISDITIGDAWGVHKANPEWNDNKGCSLVIVNTEKGKDLFSEIQSEVNVKQVNIVDYLQPNLQQPSKAPADREAFWTLYDERGYDAIAAKYGQPGKKQLVKDTLIRFASVLHMKGLVKKIW